MLLPTPAINRNLCIGCGTCVDTCPVDALALQNDVAVVINPEACTFCPHCEDLCPTGAIERRFLIRFATSEELGLRTEDGSTNSH